MQQVLELLSDLAADAALIAATMLAAYVSLWALHHLRADVFSDRLKRGIGWWKGR